MNKKVSVENRQKRFRVDARYLRQLTETLLRTLLELRSYELGIGLVDAAEMARLNQTYLRHQGATDVLTFDYQETGQDGGLNGEICICLEIAASQAKRFRTTWQNELVRYVVHGTLHLLGYDDHRAADRRKMKREEDRLLAQLVSGRRLEKLDRGSAKARKRRVPARKRPQA